MRINRKRQVHAKVLPMPVASLIVLSVTIALVYCWTASKYNELGREVQKYEQELAKATDSCIREDARWKRMITPDGLDEAERRLGIRMRLPTPDQIVRVDGTGRPMEGQPSLAKSRSELKSLENIARNKQTHGKEP